MKKVHGQLKRALLALGVMSVCAASGWMVPSLAQSVTLDRFEIKTDDQAVKIILYTDDRAHFTTENRNGSYAVVLNNAKLSQGQIKNGLPVVMDNANKFIGRAVPSGDKVKIILPNLPADRYSVSVVQASPSASVATASASKASSKRRVATQKPKPKPIEAAPIQVAASTAETALSAAPSINPSVTLAPPPPTQDAHHNQNGLSFRPIVPEVSSRFEDLATEPTLMMAAASSRPTTARPAAPAETRTRAASQKSLPVVVTTPERSQAAKAHSHQTAMEGALPPSRKKAVEAPSPVIEPTRAPIVPKDVALAPAPPVLTADSAEIAQQTDVSSLGAVEGEQTGTLVGTEAAQTPKPANFNVPTESGQNLQLLDLPTVKAVSGDPNPPKGPLAFLKNTAHWLKELGLAPLLMGVGVMGLLVFGAALLMFRRWLSTRRVTPDGRLTRTFPQAAEAAFEVAGAYANTPYLDPGHLQPAGGTVWNAESGASPTQPLHRNPITFSDTAVVDGLSYLVSEAESMDEAIRRAAGIRFSPPSGRVRPASASPRREPLATES